MLQYVIIHLPLIGEYKQIFEIKEAHRFFTCNSLKHLQLNSFPEIKTFLWYPKAHNLHKPNILGTSLKSNFSLPVTANTS